MRPNEGWSGKRNGEKVEEDKVRGFRLAQDDCAPRKSKIIVLR